MKQFLEQLHHISTFIFDVDGVMTNGSILVTEAGEQLRSFNVKDGYAIQAAVKCGYHICVISGGRSEGVLKRLNSLGITDVSLGVVDKMAVMQRFISEKGLTLEEIIYLGDDIPDIEVMEAAGLAVCPADAAEEVKAIASYISPLDGGNACVREIIEKVMKVQGKWMLATVPSK